GGVAEAVAADVTDEHAVARANEQIVASLGPVDVLVNNAGVGSQLGPMWEVDPARWLENIQINLGGTFLCSRTVLPSMVERQSGRIINIVSNAGAHRWPYFSAYSVSKAAVIKLTENL